MALLDPVSTTMGDLVNEALKEAGVVGVGQTALAEDFQIGWSRLQWMLQQWERKRWLVYHLVNLSVVSTGALTYTVGPGGNIDTGVNSARPSKIESGFVRQITSASPSGRIDYQMGILQSREDYDSISLKQLASFPGWFFLDASWPLATLYTWPVTQANIYEIHLTVREQLPNKFANQATLVNLPFEYYEAILYNLAIRIRQRFSIPSYPGDMLPILAKDALNVLRTSNVQVARLKMPGELVRGGLYNVYSDRNY